MPTTQIQLSKLIVLPENARTNFMRTGILSHRLMQTHRLMQNLVVMEGQPKKSAIPVVEAHVRQSSAQSRGC
jgi:hypothetical protein